MTAVLDRIAAETAAAVKAAAETSAREVAHKDDVVKALDKAWASTEDYAGKVSAAFTVTERVVRKAESTEDRLDAASALVRLLDGTHDGLSVDDAQRRVERAQTVLHDVERVRATRDRLARLLLSFDVARADVARVCGIGEEMVKTLGQVAGIMRDAKAAGLKLSERDARAIVRAGKLTAARAAVKAGTDPVTVLPGKDETPDPVTSATADMAERLARMVKSLPSIVVGKDDADAVRAVAAAAEALSAWAESHGKAGKAGKASA